MDEPKIYNTRQRGQILAFFERHAGSCFSARQVIDSPEISVGEATVYRCLALLTDEGRLRRFISEKGGASFYQLTESPGCAAHFHLKCLECGRVVHMDCGFMNDFEKHIEQRHDFCVDNSKTVIYGVCALCKEHRSE